MSFARGSKGVKYVTHTLTRLNAVEHYYKNVKKSTPANAGNGEGRQAVGQVVLMARKQVIQDIHTTVKEKAQMRV